VLAVAPEIADARSKHRHEAKPKAAGGDVKTASPETARLSPMRDPRSEAFERLAGRYEVRVLEPSPPAVSDPPWFADDPVARGHVAAGRQLVSPVATGDVRWDDLAAGNADLGQWCAERWLGAYRRLGPPPASLTTTRLALHRLAEAVLSPARERANGKIALRYTRGGFGTPFFGEDEQLRVESTELIADGPAGTRRHSIESLAQAAAFAGTDAPAEDAALTVDDAASRLLGDWYGFGASVLEELRAEAPPELEPSRVQLWPEHFDLAVDLGSEAARRRAGFGASPGDERHDEPYLYVVPWESSAASGPGWNATAFAGAELPYSELLAAADQRDAALAFMRSRLTALAG
jgi:hypothetical protein